MLIRLAGFLKYAKFSATFMLVISAVSCGGGSSESGSGGGSADADDPTGHYDGKYSGDCSGSWEFYVEYDSGTLTGRTQDCDGAPIQVTGTIDTGWNIKLGKVGVGGFDYAYFTGNINRSLRVTGTWVSWIENLDGTFTGKCSYLNWYTSGTPYCA